MATLTESISFPSTTKLTRKLSSTVWWFFTAFYCGTVSGSLINLLRPQSFRLQDRLNEGRCLSRCPTLCESLVSTEKKKENFNACFLFYAWNLKPNCSSYCTHENINNFKTDEVESVKGIERNVITLNTINSIRVTTISIVVICFSLLSNWEVSWKHSWMFKSILSSHTCYYRYRLEEKKNFMLKGD